MLSHYYTIKEDGQYEIEIKKSRFICTLKRIESEEMAREYIQQLKKEHWKATHNCSAYVLGDKQEIQRSSDDGEPSGTAGVPMLEVLKVKQLRNVLAVVTRYFGGTKLGAGGLIRAYSQSVSEALKHIGIVEGVLMQEVQVTVGYPLHGKLEYFLQQADIYVKDTAFTERVTVSCMITEDRVQAFRSKLDDLLSGQYDIQLKGTDYFETPVPPSN